MFERCTVTPELLLVLSAAVEVGVSDVLCLDESYGESVLAGDDKIRCSTF